MLELGTRLHRGDGRDRRRQDDGGHRRWACSWAAAPTPARSAPVAARRVEGVVDAGPSTACRRARSRTPAASSRTAGLLLARQVSAEGRSRAFAGGAGVPGGAAGPSSPSRWSPCTASPTSTGCCAPSRAARRPGPLRRRGGGWRCATASPPATPRLRDRRVRAGRGRGHRPRARPGGRPAAVRARGDRDGRPAARRGHRPRRRGVAARVRRLAAAGRRAGPRAPSRPTTPTTPTRSAPSPPPAGSSTTCATTTRRRPALADRLAELSYLLSDLAADVASYASRSRDRPGAAGGGLGPARGAGRPHPQVRRHRRRGAVLGPDLGRAAGRPRRHRRTDRGARATRCAAIRAELADASAPTCPRAAASAAGRLGEVVTEELTALAMPHAVLAVAVSQHEVAAGRRRARGHRAGARHPAGRMSSHGVDEVELLLAANVGSEPRALAKGASGGELSRVMLALEVALAGTDPVPDVRLRRGRRRRRRQGRGRGRAAGWRCWPARPRSSSSPTCRRSRPSPTSTSW